MIKSRRMAYGILATYFPSYVVVEEIAESGIRLDNSGVWFRRK